MRRKNVVCTECVFQNLTHLPYPLPPAAAARSQMVLENFKSYGGERVVGPFHKRFSSIVGPNGQSVHIPSPDSQPREHSCLKHKPHSHLNPHPASFIPRPHPDP